MYIVKNSLKVIWFMRFMKNHFFQAANIVARYRGGGGESDIITGDSSFDSLDDNDNNDSNEQDSIHNSQTSE